MRPTHIVPEKKVAGTSVPIQMNPAKNLQNCRFTLMRPHPETKSKAPKTKVEFKITSGPALMKWRKERGISRKLFAAMADCSERTLATCEKADKIPKTLERPVIETARLLRALKDLAGNDIALNAWLSKPTHAFGNQTPLTLIENGASDRLWEMVFQLRQRAFA
jgi:hypothetical protein